LPDCLFCRVAAKELPSTAVYEDDLCYAFRDINPAAPVHVLVIPKKHLESLDAATGSDAGLLGHLMTIVPRVAALENVEGNYRVVVNNGQDAGQSVGHLHLHVLGGRQLRWPPG
jgi:histidine triad (HIT) family protein